jgi:hypothetical protein
MERYTSAIRSLKNMVSWWEALNDVERAGTQNIAKLVLLSEEIIAGERDAWKLTASKLNRDVAGTKDETSGEQRDKQGAK